MDTVKLSDVLNGALFEAETDLVGVCVLDLDSVRRVESERVISFVNVAEIVTLNACDTLDVNDRQLDIVIEGDMVSE